MYICIYIYQYTYICLFICSANLYIYIPTQICVTRGFAPPNIVKTALTLFLSLCVYIYISTHAYIHAHIHKYIHILMYCIFIYMHIYTDTQNKWIGNVSHSHVRTRATPISHCPHLVHANPSDIDCNYRCVRFTSRVVQIKCGMSQI